ALGTMPIAATVVGNRGEAAPLVRTARHVPAERCRAAVLDRAHHLQLSEAHMAAVGRTPSGPMVTEQVRDLQGRTGQGAPTRPAIVALAAAGNRAGSRPIAADGSRPACSAWWCPAWRARAEPGSRARRCCAPEDASQTSVAAYAATPRSRARRPRRLCGRHD